MTAHPTTPLSCLLPRSSPSWRLRAEQLGKHQPQSLPAANGGRRRQLHTVVIDVPLSEAVEQLVERDPSFQARQVRAEAVVQPLTEREVADVVAVDVEVVGVLVSTG